MGFSSLHLNLPNETDLQIVRFFTVVHQIHGFYGTQYTVNIEIQQANLYLL